MELIHRRAVRALILSPQNEVLLIRIRRPDRASGFWIAPGGGLELGEDAEQALRRELREELSLTDVTVGPLVWRRHHTFNWNGRRISQREEYRIVITERFEPIMTDPADAVAVDQFRWWPIANLSLIADPVTPLTLADILGDYLIQGAPAVVLDEEVVID